MSQKGLINRGFSSILHHQFSNMRNNHNTRAIRVEQRFGVYTTIIIRKTQDSIGIISVHILSTEQQAFQRFSRSNPRLPLWSGGTGPASSLERKSSQTLDATLYADPNPASALHTCWLVTADTAYIVHILSCLERGIDRKINGSIDG